MRNPVHSRFDSSGALSPHRNELLGAENSGSENTSPTVEKGTHVEVTTNEVDIVLLHTPMKPVKKISGCITFFSHDIVNVY